MIELDAIQTGLLIGWIFAFPAGFAAALAMTWGRRIVSAPARRAPVKEGKRGSNLYSTNSAKTKAGDARAR